MTMQTLLKTVADPSGSDVPQKTEYCPQCGRAIARLPLGAKLPEFKGKVAIVHAEDAERLKGRRFHCDVNRVRADGSKLVYARQRNGDRPGVRLHTLIVEMNGIDPTGLQVDHANHDTLDNRGGCNLRVITPTQNVHNHGVRRDSKTGYKGVTKEGDVFVAQITFQGKTQRIGTFETAIEAAVSYNWAALRLYGAFAWLNPIESVAEAIA